MTQSDGNCRNNFQSWRKIGGNWRKKGGNGGEMTGKWNGIPSFHSPILPIFPGVEDLPHSQLYKKSTHRPHRRNNGNCRHSPTLTATAAGADGCSLGRRPSICNHPSSTCPKACFPSPCVVTPKESAQYKGRWRGLRGTRDTSKNHRGMRRAGQAPAPTEPQPHCGRCLRLLRVHQRRRAPSPRAPPQSVDWDCGPMWWR